MSHTESYQSKSALFAALFLSFACDGSSGDSTNRLSDNSGGTVGSGGASKVANTATQAGGASSTSHINGTSATGGSSSPTGECVADATAICTAAADRGVRCGDTLESERAARYDTCVTRMAAQFNCAFANSFSSCLETLACDGDDESCVYEGLVDAKPEGWDVDVINACLDGTTTDEDTCRAALGGPTRTCLTRYDECAAAAEDQVSPFIDDRCFTLGALSTSAVTKGVACLSLECDAIGACLTLSGTFSY